MFWCCWEEFFNSFLVGAVVIWLGWFWFGGLFVGSCLIQMAFGCGNRVRLVLFECFSSEIWEAFDVVILQCFFQC